MKNLYLVLSAIMGVMPLVAQDNPPPVLMVVANQDFYYPDYIEPLVSLQAQGLDVIVAAPTRDRAIPHGGSPSIQPDFSLAEVDASSYSAIVLVGGYGAASYQYAFEGTYDNSLYGGDVLTKLRVNQLINDFLAQDKKVAAICHGVSVLAWARVDGVSPLAGRTVSAYAGTSPSFSLQGNTFTNPLTRWHIEANASTMVADGSIGDPSRVEDDVYVDGNLVTAQDYRAGAFMGEVLAHEIRNWWSQQPEPTQPVLMVVANQDFYYQEYGDTRYALELAGYSVEVAAEHVILSHPHRGTGEPANFEGLMPDLSIADAVPASYSAIVFVGGWGSSQYQYDYPGTYLNPTYVGNSASKAVVNDLINDFVDQDKWVAAICHGVSVLAWARVDGASPLDGKEVCTYQGGSPASTIDGITYANHTIPTSWHMSQNGSQTLAPNSVGATWTAVDDVWVDSSFGIKVITAQNWDSATMFGQTLALMLSDE